MQRRLIPKLELEYLKSQIESGDPNLTKRGLQEFCRLSRLGWSPYPDQRVRLEQSIFGLFSTQVNVIKTAKWALTALAHVGSRNVISSELPRILKNHLEHPEVVASGIATIYKLSAAPEVDLQALDIDQTMRALAGLQHAGSDKFDARLFPLKVDIATSEQLKLALILTGLNRAPPNLFDPRHDNRKLVKVLGKHHDPIVAQYSVWAIAENDELGIDDLGIPLHHIDGQPPNVRAWIYRLLAASRNSLTKHLDVFEHGINDRDQEARLGLAIGLLDTYFDGLSPLVMDWFFSESEFEVRNALCRHICRQSRHCAEYESFALEIFESTETSEATRSQMLAYSAKTDLYSKLKTRSLEPESLDLFGEKSVTNNFNINGNLNAGLVAIGGDITNSGSVQTGFNGEWSANVERHLNELKRLLESQQDKTEEIQSLLAQIANSQATKSKDDLAKTKSMLSQFSAKIGGAVGFAANVATISAALLGGS